MQSPGNVLALVPIPGAGELGNLINFLTSFIKGKTKHASWEQVSPSSNAWAATVEASFSDFSDAEQLMICQKATPLLLQAMQEKFGMGGQGQPALANSITGHVPTIRTLAATLYTWIAINVDAEMPETFTTFMAWGWNYVFVTAMQQAGVDEKKVISKSPIGGGGGSVSGKTIGVSLVLVLVVIVVLVLVLKKGK